MTVQPMPFTPFEHYMMLDDTPRSPMSFFFRLGFGGRLDRTRLESALCATLATHPLLGAQMRGTIFSRLRWIWVNEVQPDVRELPAAAALAYADFWIDLRSQLGMRWWIRDLENGTEILCQFHHCCCDGIGALHFLESWLAAYDRALDAEPRGARTESALDRCDAHRQLRDRMRLDTREARQRGRLRDLAADVARLVRFTRFTPTKLCTARASVPGGDGPLFLAHALSAVATTGLREAARRQQVTVNDVLLRDLFCTVGRWMANRAIDARVHRLRIAVPVNTRGADEMHPACNSVSMVFLDRRSDELANAADLLQGIRRETLAIKEHCRDRELLTGLKYCTLFPQVQYAMLNMGRCMATSLLSNLGVVFGKTALRQPDGRLQTGGVTLDCVEFYPPVRPMSPAIFGTFTYADRLYVCLHCDGRVLLPGDAESLLATFVGHIAESIH